MKTKNFYWVAQIGGWSLLAALILLANLSNESDDQIPTLLITAGSFFIFGICISHSMRWVMIKLGWLNMRLNHLIPRILVIGIIAALIMSMTSNFSIWMLNPETYNFHLLEYFLDAFASSLFFLLWNGVYFTFHFFQKSRSQEVANLQLIASQHEIELKNLRSQLNPHFLFNSLNSIRALIDIDPNQAQANLTTLSSILRKSLILGREQLIPMPEEIKLVHEYLELEQVRFEERLRIKIVHDEQLNDFLIPPFIIQTLVENAIKHGVSKLIEGGEIQVITSKKDNKVTISVINDGQLLKVTDTGIGISNTIRRLELQYGQNANFELEQLNNKVSAKITLKIIQL